MFFMLFYVIHRTELMVSCLVMHHFIVKVFCEYQCFYLVNSGQHRMICILYL